jgi:hypothetical protein
MSWCRGNHHSSTDPEILAPCILPSAAPNCGLNPAPSPPGTRPPIHRGHTHHPGNAPVFDVPPIVLLAAFAAFLLAGFVKGFTGLSKLLKSDLFSMI